MQNNQDPRDMIEQENIEDNLEETADPTTAEEVPDAPAEIEDTDSPATEETLDSSTVEAVSISSAEKEASDYSATEEARDTSAVKETSEYPATEEVPDSPAVVEVTDLPAAEEALDSSEVEVVTDSSAAEEVSISSAEKEASDYPATEEVPDYSAAEEVPDSAIETEMSGVPVEGTPPEAGRKMQDLHSKVHNLPKDEATQDFADKGEDIDIVKSGRTYAGFCARLSAYLLDRLILLIPLGLLRLILWFITIGHADHILNQNIFFRFTPVSIIMYAAATGYFVILTYITGRTIGKRIMRLKVVSADEERKPTLIEILYRETFGRFLSGVVLCIGYFMIIIGDEKEALHDYLADTRVIYR